MYGGSGTPLLLYDPTNYFWGVVASSLVEDVSDVLTASIISPASETYDKFYETTQHKIPEENHLRPHCRENFKCHYIIHLLLKERRA